MAFAPKFVLFLVPSSSRSKLSRTFWFNSLPVRAFLMIVFTLFTALVTPARTFATETLLIAAVLLAFVHFYIYRTERLNRNLLV